MQTKSCKRRSVWIAQNNTLWVSVLIPTPCMLVVIERVPITWGALPPSPEVAAWLRSTMFTEPAPPGVTTAQFNLGLMATAGFTPFLCSQAAADLLRTPDAVETSSTVAKFVA